MRSGLYELHRELLRTAVRAVEAGERVALFTRQSGRVAHGRRGAAVAADGEAAFRSHLGRDFPLDQPGRYGTVGGETSPYGIRLDVGYPRCDPAELVEAATRAMAGWRAAGTYARAGVAAEILRRLNGRGLEIAHAVHHTTGQGFATAYRLGGPAAHDRGLEAVAHALAESAAGPAPRAGRGRTPGAVP